MVCVSLLKIVVDSADSYCRMGVFFNIPSVINLDIIVAVHGKFMVLYTKLYGIFYGGGVKNIIVKNVD